MAIVHQDGDWASHRASHWASHMYGTFISSDLDSLRNRFLKEGFSGKASNLMNSRRKGTTTNYDSTWKKWVLWCGERSLDPVTDFLVSLLEKGYEYSGS